MGKRRRRARRSPGRWIRQQLHATPAELARTELDGQELVLLRDAGLLDCVRCGALVTGRGTLSVEVPSGWASFCSRCAPDLLDELGEAILAAQMRAARDAG